jgi:general secretion pathway protein H
MTSSARVRSGFTLLELMLVLAILAVAGAMVVPYLTGSISALRLGKSTERVFAAAREGRGLATLRGLRLRLVLDFDARTFWLEEERHPLLEPGRWFEMPEREEKPYALSDGVRFDELILEDQVCTEGQAEIYFRPDGTADNALITLAHDDEDFRIIEVRGVTGRVRIMSDEDIERLREEFDPFATFSRKVRVPGTTGGRDAR